MKPSAGAAVLIALLTFALAAEAAPRARAAAHRPAVTARGARRPGTPGTGPAPATAAGAGARTLDDIRIEGEIAVPQVLFITARDQRRFMEFQNRRYLRTSAQLGQATAMPGWILVTPTPITAGKEIAR